MGHKDRSKLGASNPSSVFSVQRAAAGMLNPQKKHWNEMNRIKNYKATNPEIGIVFRAADPPEILKKGQNLDCLTLFADADLGGCPQTAKSYSGWCAHLGNSGMFDFKTKKQTCVAQSSCESETMCNKSATCDVVWYRGGLEHVGFTFSKPTPVCQDNRSAIALCKSDKHHSRTRHFRLHVNFLKDSHSKGIAYYPWVPSVYMRGDLFNKVHGPARHEQLCYQNQISERPIEALPDKGPKFDVEGWMERWAAMSDEEKRKFNSTSSKM